MTSAFRNLFSLSISALAFFLPVGTVFIFRNAESQYERVLFTATDAMLAAVVITGVLYWIHTQDRDRTLHRVAASLAAFLAIAVLSLFFIPDPSIVNVATLLRLAAGSCAVLCIAMVPSVKHTAFAALVISGVIQAAYGILQFAVQHVDPISLLGVAAHSPLNLGDAVVQTSQMRFLRAYGSFAHPNILGAFLGVCFFVNVFLIQNVRAAFHRAAFTASALIITIGILLTFSRGVWVAIVAALLVSYCIDRWYSSRTSPKTETGKKSLQILTFGGLAICVLFVFFFSDVIASRFGITGDARLEIRSVDERLTSANDAIALIQSHPFGIGIGNYVPYRMEQDRLAGSLLPLYEYQPVHSHLLLVLAELGIIGFAAFLTFLYSVFSVMKKRSAASVYSRPFFMLLCSIGAFVLVSGLFDHAYWTIPSAIILWWFCIGLLLRIRPI